MLVHLLIPNNAVHLLIDENVVLQDYTHEFHKTKANFQVIREREDLLGSVRKDIE